MNIKGAIAVITGAAGGIGRALAVEMVKRKVAKLALVDQNESVQQVVKAINELADSSVAVGYGGDVTNPEFRRLVYREMAQNSGPVNICVPAAGITRDSLAVKVDKETKEVSIYHVEEDREPLAVSGVDEPL